MGIKRVQVSSKIPLSLENQLGSDGRLRRGPAHKVTRASAGARARAVGSAREEKKRPAELGSVVCARVRTARHIMRISERVRACMRALAHRQPLVPCATHTHPRALPFVQGILAPALVAALGYHVFGFQTALACIAWPFFYVTVVAIFQDSEQESSPGVWGGWGGETERQRV